MNKLTKVGLSALCGSLAAFSSANAGDRTVTGGVDMSWISLDDDTTGNPIGMGSNLTFSGSGELTGRYCPNFSRNFCSFNKVMPASTVVVRSNC